MKLCAALRKTRGFTLLEMAVVLVIVGLMVGLAAQTQNATQPSGCYAATKQQLATIREAITGFTHNHNRLPIPAARNLGVRNPMFGREAPSDSDSSIDLLDNANDILFGALPFQALGLPSSYAVDCWGNKFTYVVTRAMTSDSATGGYPDATVSGGITLKSSAGVTVADAAATPSTGLSYVVISHGENGSKVGGVPGNYSGGGHGWCSVGAALDTENCDIANNIIVAAEFNNGVNAGAAYFDDLVSAEAKPPGSGCPYMEATGGTETTDGDYKVHTFTTDGTFTVTCLGNPGTVQVLVVGGGGGGGGAKYWNAGGGGAGGLVEHSAKLLTETAYPVTIGLGGIGGRVISNSGPFSGTNGGNSVFSDIVALGGGFGSQGYHPEAAANSGGSGGGGGWAFPTGAVATQTGSGGGVGYGNAGGNTAAGGGGAGGIGGNGGNGLPGVGRMNPISGSAVSYAAGGRGSSTVYQPGLNGPANSGNGGGAAIDQDGGNELVDRGGTGGSGIVIIRYRYQSPVCTGFPAVYGGARTTDGDYKVHTFTTNQTMTVDCPGTAQIFLVGGGGSGGNNGGGGGGGGGWATDPAYALIAGDSIAVTIGEGGAATPYDGVPGTNGEDSVFGSLTAKGGGGGGSKDSSSNGLDGGSGGGGGGGAWVDIHGSGTPGQGNDGGNGYNSGNNSGGGGGGGGGAGSASGPSLGGNGGPGIANSITGSVTYYGGGGGGGLTWDSATGGSGGIGGGGNGAGPPVLGSPGAPNTGGGGGGGGQYSGKGGSGVAIVRYKFQ